MPRLISQVIKTPDHIEKPYFRVKKNTNQEDIQSFTGKVPFQSVEIDNYSGWSTSNHNYTVPQTGLYAFGFRFYASIRSGGVRVVHIFWRVNDSNTLDATCGGGVGGDGGYAGHPTVCDNCVLYLNAGDTVDMSVSSCSATEYDWENGYMYGYKIN